MRLAQFREQYWRLAGEGRCVAAGDTDRERATICFQVDSRDDAIQFIQRDGGGNTTDPHQKVPHASVPTAKR